MVVTRQERHFEPSVRRVLGTDKEPNAESANRESPGCGVVAAPMADEPSEDEGDQPDATNPQKVMPHRRICDFALGASWPESTNLFAKEIGPARGRIVGPISSSDAPWSAARCDYPSQSSLTRGQWRIEFKGLRTKSGSLAMLAAMRRASSRVSRLAASRLAVASRALLIS